MNVNNDDVLTNHIKNWSLHSEEDRCAVATLKDWLAPGGKIADSFNADDKVPNTDGDFELIPDPELDRRPVQKFIVQIKGTNVPNITKDRIVKYNLKDLAFPAYIAKEVTLDPGILFVVLYPNSRSRKRVFWKYISSLFIKSIDFSRRAQTIDLLPQDELFNTDESIDAFVKKLAIISDRHSFMKQLETREYTIKDVLTVIEKRCKKISQEIAEGNEQLETRDQISERMITYLKDVCEGTLLANSLKYYRYTNLRAAWELALTDIDTKFLAGFLEGLRYIGLRLPEEGQYERLMVKYRSFLWQIRDLLFNSFNISVLPNLEDYPMEINEEDQEFNNLVAYSIESVQQSGNPITNNRYYIQKKEPFYISNKRYFEYTLQLANKYATKYNRITAYSQLDISSNYPIQIGYAQTVLHIWDQPMRIKVITAWRVSISPTVLNKLSKILKYEKSISSRYNEYHALMNYLSETGINFLDLVDFSDEGFRNQLSRIYDNANTQNFREVLKILHANYNNHSEEKGKNTIRYAIISLREDLLDNILPQYKNDIMDNCELLLSKRCIPFELHPLLYNLPKKKTNAKTLPADLLRAYGTKSARKYLPYVRIKHYIEETGELYHKKEIIDPVGMGKSVIEFNQMLRLWDNIQGCRISEEDGYLYIDEYVNNTVAILNRLLQYSSVGNEGQQQLNNSFLNSFDETGVDKQKIATLKKMYIDSRVLVIYGAAGTGKTTLLNYISNLFGGSRKVFLTKTHAALDNLKKRISDKGYGSLFDVIDHFTGQGTQKQDFDVVFVDECSTIDNRTMLKLFGKIGGDSLLVCAGDIYQLESIDFGNWFFYAKDILPTKAMVELTGTWRTNDETLINLWEAVRFNRSVIREMLVIDGPFSKNIGKEIFCKQDEDEVVLCLNYDGKYGLNCINNYFQDANPEPEYYWAEWTYKANDPVLFNENKRFPMLYNNLKGKIVAIEKGNDCLYFTIDIPIVLTALHVKGSDLSIVSNTEETTRVRFGVFENTAGELDSNFEEAQMKSIVPFQLAYAVSIHKAQGLEYNSIKLVIPKSISEKITHGVFYTAITRTKKHLKIYCSADTLETIRKSFEKERGGAESLKYIRRRLKQATL